MEGSLTVSCAPRSAIGKIRALQEHLVGRAEKVTISIGAFYVPSSCKLGFEEAIAKVDKVLYRVKETNKGTYPIEG